LSALVPRISNSDTARATLSALGCGFGPDTVSFSHVSVAVEEDIEEISCEPIKISTSGR